MPHTESKIHWPSKFKLLAAAHTILYIADWVFDHILYPIVLVWLGFIQGLFVMMILATIYCLLILFYYIESKEDWLGVDVVQAVQKHGHKWVERLYSKEGRWWKLIHIIAYIPAKIFTLVLFLSKKNDISAFWVLSMYEDAFKTTAYLRHGRKGSMTKKDWWVFFSSIVISNLWWTLRWSVIIVLLKGIFL